MSVTVHLNAVVPAKDNLPAGLSGVVAAIGEGMKDDLKPGDKVIACPLTVAATADTLTPGGTVTVDGKSVSVKPSQLSFETAAKVAQALPLAALIFAEGVCGQGCFDTLGANPPANGQAEASSANSAPETAIATPSCTLVTAGETLLGTLIAYLLKQHSPTTQLYSTSSGLNDSVLTATCSRIVGYAGAIYAIDAEAPDLLEHLQAATEEYSGKQGMDIVVDVSGFLARKPEVREVLREGGMVVDVKGLRARGGLMEVVEEEGLVRRLGRLLEDVPEELFQL